MPQEARRVMDLEREEVELHLHGCEETRESSWIGAPTGASSEDLEDGQVMAATQYGSVRLGSEVIHVGDFVYLTPDEVGEPCEVALVRSLFEADETAEKMLRVQWFWRPEHITMPRQMVYDEREVYLSDTVDV